MNRLKELRKEKKLSQKEIAKEMSISEKTLSRWENGESQIKPEKAQQLAKYFEVSVGYLLGYSEYREIEKALDKTIFSNYSDVETFLNQEIKELIGERVKKFYEYIDKQFYESYKNTAVPPEIVVKHREDFYSSFLFLPARLQKFIALWSILTETEQENIGKTIELLAMRGR
ncbi:helix-turn-helix transcriptional regulator [Streptococcus sp. k-628]|uniref:helix-turn-helix domain-containing protein n=1 Tax=Streptococcus sp. k-628 TaxID=2582635 RepID=UPI0005E34F43|nr:helix-turn-helix transcriptional regulator [Streptococcus sp. k-628]CJD44768.1 XRE family transcriptional regulator [Streptococcus pneumoniae]